VPLQSQKPGEIRRCGRSLIADDTWEVLSESRMQAMDGQNDAKSGRRRTVWRTG